MRENPKYLPLMNLGNLLHNKRSEWIYCPIPVIERTCQHDHIALPHRRINFVHVIPLDTGTLKMVGEVLVPGVLNVGDIAKTDGCKQAAALAEKF